MAPRLEREQLRQFVVAYIKHGGNGAAAYRASHPRCKSANAAAAGGNRLLRNSQVRAALKQRLAKHEITAERVLQVAAGIAYAVPADEPKHADVGRMVEFLGKYLGLQKEQPPPAQWSLDPATLGKMSTTELETALKHAEAVQAILSGKPTT